MAPSPQSALSKFLITSHERAREVRKSIVMTLGAAVPHLYQKDEDSIVVVLSIMHSETRTGCVKSWMKTLRKFLDSAQ